MPKREHFPGFEACLTMIKSRDGALAEAGFQLMRPHASEYVDQLITAFWEAESPGLQYWLLELIGESSSQTAISFLVGRLHGERDDLRRGATFALQKLNTKDARRALWEAGIPTH